MNADSDRAPVVAKLVKGLRFAGGRLRRLRADPHSFYSECTDLDLAHWSEEKFPGVLYGEPVSQLMRQLVLGGAPAMVGRLGSTELATMSSALTPLNPKTAWKLATGSVLVRDIGIHPGLVGSLAKLSGFFPATVSHCRQFVALMQEDLKQVDVLGTWCKQEALFADQLPPGAQRVRFRDLEPYMHQRPWSAALAGKRVLVIHPFAEAIQRQFSLKRAQLFPGSEVLPSFELITIKAVQSIANNECGFPDWFAALNDMKRQMEANRFDVAIIGCGAYGFPLAAHAKRIGKIGIHLGGQTQLLFGIKGKRWETGHDKIKALFNEHWIYPDEADRPRNFTAVEGGAYW